MKTTNNFYNEAHEVIEINACDEHVPNGGIDNYLHGIGLVAVWVGLLFGSWAAVGLLVYLAFRAI